MAQQTRFAYIDTDTLTRLMSATRELKRLQGKLEILSKKLGVDNPLTTTNPNLTPELLDAALHTSEMVLSVAGPVRGLQNGKE